MQYMTAIQVLPLCVAGKNVEEKPIVVADSSSYNSLLEMAKQTRVVLNCVGPVSCPLLRY